jgi:hypothetical protein
LHSPTFSKPRPRPSTRLKEAILIPICVWFVTRQPPHKFAQLIIFVLQTINIVCKLNILQSNHFTIRKSICSRGFQSSLKGTNLSMRF